MSILFLDMLKMNKLYEKGGVINGHCCDVNFYASIEANPRCKPICHEDGNGFSKSERREYGGNAVSNPSIRTCHTATSRIID